MFGVLPPGFGSLDVYCVRFYLFDESASAVSQSRGRVGGADESQGAFVARVRQSQLGVLEGIVAVSHSVVHIRIDVGVPDELVYYLRSHKMLYNKPKGIKTTDINSLMALSCSCCLLH